MTTYKTFPEGWDEHRIRQVLEHYESQTEDEALAEDEEAWKDITATFVDIPNNLLFAVRQLLATRTT